MATATPAPALEMRGIDKRFGPVAALKQVSLEVRPGTVHALVGENGAGKSTLMKILAGVHRADAGNVRVAGRRCSWASPAAALNGGVAMIYQELSLAPDLSVADNVFLGVEPRGPYLPGTVDHGRMVEETRKLAERHGFDLDPTERIEHLSAADCQIVEILKALARNASIIVMDEPTSSLGRAEAAALLDVVRGLRDRGVAVVYISHRLEEIMELADDVTILRDGQAVHSSPLAELDIKEIVKHMVGRELGDYYPARAVEQGPTRLRVDHLSTVAGVDDVSFHVRGGEVLGVAGLVGAGRTKLAEALFGVQRLAAGTISLDGQPFVPQGPADALQRGLSYLTEDRKRTGLCLELPAAWNVTLPCLQQLGMRWLVNPTRETELVTQAVDKLSLKWSGPEAPASSLSGGNQQKLLFARALLADSQLVILDEPTRGIDIAAKVDIYRLLGDLAADGKSILLISSELPELLGVTDRLLVMRRGRIVGDLVTAETTQEEVMQLAAVGREEDRA